jgi:tetratricopeptide (TPR) repeat protein
MSRLRVEFLVAFALAVGTGAVFSRTLGNDFINYDDPLYVTENLRVQQGITPRTLAGDFLSFEVVNWHPLTWMSYRLDYQLYGLRPWGYHLTNVLLHTVNVVLLFAALRWMSGSVWRSAVAAALFALHPLRIEPVAWIAARKDLLSTTFCMLALLAYVGYARRRRAALYVLVAVSFTLGLMAKSMLVTFPFILLLLDYWPLGRLQLRAEGGLALRRCIVEKLPLLGLAIVSGVLTLLAQQQGGGPRLSYPLAQRLSSASVFYVQYLGKLAWPMDLFVFYPYPATPFPWWQVAGAAVLIVLISVLAWRSAATRPYLVVGWLWFLGTTAPVIGIVEVLGGQGLADRYAYVPFIGLFLMLVWGMGEWVVRWHRPVLAGGAVALLLGFYGVLDWRGEEHWKDSVTLWQRGLAIDPDNGFAHRKWGDALFVGNDLEGAMSHYREALRIDPNDSDTHINVGMVLHRQGNVAGAMEHYREAARLNPRDVVSRNNLGKLLRDQGNAAEAVDNFRAALRLQPRFTDAAVNLGVMLLQQGDLEGAFRCLQNASETDPESDLVRLNLGVALERRGQTDAAEQCYREAMRLKPDSAIAHHNLGVLLERRGNFRDAEEEYQAALKSNPNLAQAHTNLGRIQGMQGRLDEAIPHLLVAVRLQPKNASAHFNLATVFENQGARDEATLHYQQAVALRPDSALFHRSLAHALFQQQKTGAAAAEYQEALRLDPQWPLRQRQAAWLMATHPDPLRRNGRLALTLASQACEASGTQDPLLLDTLAAAHAEVGEFDQAVAVARQAAALASPDLRKEIDEHLRCYENRQAFRDFRSDPQSS